MSLRNIEVQYVGDTLYLPPLEREVKHIVVRNEDVKDWEHFELERTCYDYNAREHGAHLFLWRCSNCDESYDTEMDKPNYCPNCGAKAVGEGGGRMNETSNGKYFHKCCITCDAYGYKTADDYKRKRKYCFTLDRYISKPDDMICPHWKPTD